MQYSFSNIYRISDKKTFIERQRERRRANEILDNKNATVELEKRAQMEAEDVIKIASQYSC